MLCEFCPEIPFDPDNLSRLKEYRLGSGTRIKSSWCPFCRLVVRAFSKDNKDISEHADVFIMWSRDQVDALPSKSSVAMTSGSVLAVLLPMSRWRPTVGTKFLILGRITT